ncbi:carboxymuconolactone decarboxylase family protein [Actinocrispum wychmicini]|uniref:Putative peroxidase-related enzyme n=1 Tax=Actinocrispum wychmicini TaxID=1213861 RepID=A0A4R2IRR3_9PSEU|nr:peroxidase-related enzyme [Actinocrispum wychmicini]TCO47432.1 putative peroxidase-related enzyme [Actinocrispum wychmicini]
MTATHSLPGVRVPVIAESDATGRVADLYETLRKATNMPFVHDVFRLTSTRPDLLEIVATGYTGMFGDGVLPRQTRELIAAWTSKLNHCPYCTGTHNWFLRQFGGSEELIAAVATANTPADLPLDEKTRTLIELATKVSTAAYKITDKDWDTAAKAGWTNPEILEAVFCAALFNFINRLVDATGLGDSMR